ncbi:MAG: hypothetical protein QNJ84_18750 [Alphaproteobacteria bacterium]|nr:hypothetical protein [Alphaproteobacteria bacterium]
MIDMVMQSSKLFFAGKLFKDNKQVMQRLAIGAGLGAIVTVGVGYVAPIWAAAIAGGLVAGVLQPILFKDLKYA